VCLLYESKGRSGYYLDPLREVQPIFERAAADKAKIKNTIFETHSMLIFVSGHITLAKENRADIVYGPLRTHLLSAS